ncbi:MAG: heparin lyase I family protein [Bacteroidota bacterium]
MKSKGWFVVLLVSLSPFLGKGQVIEYALDDFGTYCQPDNVRGGVNLTDEQVRSGTKAFLHQVENAFPRRGELDDCSFHQYNPDRIYWYGFSLFLPEASFEGNFLQFVSQWRFSNLAWGGYDLPNCEMFRECGGGAIYGGSGHHLLVHNQKWLYSLVHQDPDCADCEALDQIELTLGDIQTDVWTDFVMEANFSGEQDGYLNLWMQVDGQGYQQVAAYRGRTWVEFYQKNSDQRENGINRGRMMAPNHTVGLYFGSDNRARTMYADEISVYQEEQDIDGFAKVAIDQVPKPKVQPLGPQNWRYQLVGDYEYTSPVQVSITPEQIFEQGGWIGFSHHDHINSFEDLGIVVHFTENGILEAINGNAYQAETTIRYQPKVPLDFEFQIDTVSRKYSVLVRQLNGEFVPLATDYAFHSNWEGTGALAYFSYHSEKSGAFDLLDVKATLNCPATPKNIINFTAESERYILGFEVDVEGTNLDTAYLQLTSAASVAITLRMLPDRILEASNGATYEKLQKVALHQTAHFKIVVDENQQSYQLSTFGENGEQLLADSFLFSENWDGSPLLQLQYRTVSGGCLTVDNLETASVASFSTPCQQSEWNALPFPIEPAKFSLEHDLQLTQTVDKPAIIGISTNRQVARINDLAVYFQCLPDGSIAFVQANEQRTDIGYQLVVGERYRCRWQVDVQAGNYDLFITNAVGQTVQLATFSAFNSQWINPNNGFQQLVYSGASDRGCLQISNLKINPCGPTDWQSIPLPIRENGQLALSFQLTPQGDDFLHGELVLSSTQIPTEQSTVSQILLDSTGVFLAVNGNQQTAETTYRSIPDNRVNCRWEIDYDEQQYNFSVDKFSNFKAIATDYAFSPTWNEQPARYLCYRTYQDGCIDIGNLAEGEPCGPENWTTQPLREAIRDQLSFEVEITPTGNNFRDGVWGLSHKENPTNFNDLGPILQFNTDGTIKVRNGDEYNADYELIYSYGNTYRLKFNIDVSNKRYSVFWVDDGDLITLANNYQFRADWTGNNLLEYVAQRTVGAGCLSTNLFSLVTSLSFLPANKAKVLHLGDSRFRFEHLNFNQPYQLQVFDTLGRLVHSEVTTNQEVDLAIRPPSGVYFLQVVDKQQRTINITPFFVP